MKNIIKIFHISIQIKNTKRFQNQEPQQLNTVPDQQQDTTTLRNLPDSSDTLTVQNVSKLSDTTTNIPQSFTVTNDSNVLQIPVRNVTQNTKNDQSQKNTSTLSALNTTVTQPFQTQPSPQKFDHLFFHHNILLELLHITLLNKVPLIQMAQMYFKFNLKHNFKLLLN